MPSTLKKTKIIHIGRDSQFCKYSLDLFEEVEPNCNEFYVVGGWNKDGFLNYPPKVKLNIHPIGSIFYIYRLLKKISEAKLIIAHGMSLVGAVAFLVKKNHTKTLWSGWGYDYYGSFNDPDHNLILPETRRLINKIKYNKSLVHAIKEKIKNSIFSIISYFASTKTDYFSAPIPNDFEIFKRRYNNSKAEYKQINYGDAQSIFNNTQITINSSNILIGNSASATNNHIEIFLKLKNFDLSGRKLIVPLTYGSEEYRDSIIKIGSKMFGDSFHPLTKHLPLNEYLNLVNTCNIVIMNQLRQQAIGNIGASLYQGAYVVMNKENPAYNFLKNKTAFIESTDFLDKDYLPIGGRIKSELNQNRLLLNSIWDFNISKKNVLSLLESVKKN